MLMTKILTVRRWKSKKLALAKEGLLQNISRLHLDTIITARTPKYATDERIADPLEKGGKTIDVCLLRDHLQLEPHPPPSLLSEHVQEGQKKKNQALAS